MGSAMLSPEAASERLASSVTSSAKHSPPRVWLRAWKRGGWIRRLYGAICTDSILNLGAGSWIASLAGTRASLSAKPDDASEREIRGTSGRGSERSSPCCVPDLLLSRTSRDTSASGLTSSAEIFKRWAIALRRHCAKRRTSERLTDASACSSGVSWPTSTSSDAKGSRRLWYPGRAGQGETLTDAAIGYDWLTPTATDTKRNGGPKEFPSIVSQALAQDPAPAPRVLSARFAEALMGWPDGWTDPTRPAGDFRGFPAKRIPLLPTPTAARFGTSNNGDPGDGRGAYAQKGKPSLSTLAQRGSISWALGVEPRPTCAPGEEIERGLRLRVCGNGVVPQQAADAFVEVFAALL